MNQIEVIYFKKNEKLHCQLNHYQQKEVIGISSKGFTKFGKASRI